jgi:FtsP/CotA-like multicopper oxidase with cupredoxin domain
MLSPIDGNSAPTMIVTLAVPEAAVVDWEVSPGTHVQAWAYNGTVPGPTIQVDPGDHVKVVLDNELPQSTAIHFHGITVPNAMDGVPDVTQPPVKPGQTFTYDFVAAPHAEVGMYHSHHHAEHQVPDGLMGAFIVGSEPLPAGVTLTQQVPMVLNDAGVIGLTLNGKSFPATAPVVAKLGDWVEIQYMNEGLQIHPMHLHGLPQLVIAKDGFPTPAVRGRHPRRRAGGAVHGARARDVTWGVGLALPHPQPCGERQGHVRHGHHLRGAVTGNRASVRADAVRRCVGPFALRSGRGEDTSWPTGDCDSAVRVLLAAATR